MYEIIIDKKVLKKIEKLPREIQERIFNALEKIRIRPEAYVTKLIGESSYKLRVGEYRILLDIKINQLIILVLNIGHRRNIYKNLGA